MSIDARSLFEYAAPTLDDPLQDTYTCPDCGTTHDTQAAEADCLRSHARAEADRLASEIGPASAQTQDGRTLVTDGGTVETEQTGSRTIYLVKELKKNAKGNHYEVPSSAFTSHERAREVLHTQVAPGRIEKVQLHGDFDAIETDADTQQGESDR